MNTTTPIRTGRPAPAATAAPAPTDPLVGPILGPSGGPTPVRLAPGHVADLDLTAPVWTVQHVAAALHLDLDAACAVVARPDFPPARDGFAADLWLREHVLGWFAELPPRGLGTVPGTDTGLEVSAPAPAGAASRAGRPGGPGQQGSYRRRRAS